MIIFVGDEPSKKNINPEIAFVGTKSYKTLLDWIYRLNVSINDVIICNKEDIKTYGEGRFYTVEVPGLYADIEEEDKVISLGKNSCKFLNDVKLSHFSMPHPSGLNRKLNNKKWLDSKLKECKSWIGELQ